MADPMLVYKAQTAGMIKVAMAVQLGDGNAFMTTTPIKFAMPVMTKREIMHQEFWGVIIKTYEDETQIQCKGCPCIDDNRYFDGFYI